MPSFDAHPFCSNIVLTHMCLMQSHLSIISAGHCDLIFNDCSRGYRMNLCYLRRAMGYDGSSLKGRNLKIGYAQRKKEQA